MTGAPPAAALVSARALSARAGGRGRVLFSGLDFDAMPGELVALTGPNGSGKSTLLRVLLGLARPAGGTVARRAGLRVGYVPQLDPADEGLPFPAATVVAHGWSRRGAESPRILAVLAALQGVGFHPPPSRRYTQLSGGERRRVLLARALVGRPEFLALDEPTAGVDAEGEREVVDLVKAEVRMRGVSAVWVCHGLAGVEHAADRVIRLGAAS